MKKELLELMEIKNIGLISIYKVNYNDNNDNNIGIKIVYDENKVLDYDYKYRYFKEYLIRIREVYKRECNNVIIIGDTSDQLLIQSKLDNLFPFDTYNQKLIFPFSRMSRNNNLIRYAVKNILCYFNDDKDVKIISISHFNQKYQVKYEIDKNVHFVNFFVTSNDIDETKFIMSYINNAIKIEGIISINDDSIFFNWHSNNSIFEGKMLAFTNKNYKEEIFKVSGITNDIKEIDTIIKEEDKNKIENYLSSLNLDLVDNGILLCDNTYLLCEIKDYGDKKRKLSYYVEFNNDDVYILQSDALGILIGSTFYPTNTKKIEYILKNIQNKEYIVCEKLLNVNDNYFDYNNCRYSILNNLEKKENLDINLIKKKIKE